MTVVCFISELFVIKWHDCGMFAERHESNSSGSDVFVSIIGYPSDGIVQVEEEEEENETDNGTYTINSNTRCHDVTQQARGQSQGQGARPKTSRGRRGFPQPIRTAGGFSWDLCLVYLLGLVYTFCLSP